jgi:heme/copper-type cytochrome/quinol oxidase subunit 2
MRKLTCILFLTGLSASAGAHTLPSGSPLPLQLSHQLLSLHHLAGVILIVVAALAIRFAAKVRSSRNKQ